MNTAPRREIEALHEREQREEDAYYAKRAIEAEKRTLVATSHEGKYTYWQDADRYIYQRNEVTHVWVGWLCALSSWESTFQHSDWITLCA